MLFFVKKPGKFRYTFRGKSDIITPTSKLPSAAHGRSENIKRKGVKTPLRVRDAAGRMKGVIRHMNAIVVVDQIWAIGREGRLLFNLPADMERFKKLTEGGSIIMGRRTLNSFVEGHPLPNRRNIVVTRNADLVPPDLEVVPDPEAAVEAVAGDDPEKVWVIGGGSVYAALLSRCRRVYLTRVETVAEGEPDTYFPDLDHHPGWEKESESEPMAEDGLTYRFMQYVNKNLDSAP